MNKEKLELLIDYLKVLRNLDGQYFNEIKVAIASIEEELGIKSREQRNKIVNTINVNVDSSSNAHEVIKEIQKKVKQNDIWLGSLENKFKVYKNGEWDLDNTEFTTGKSSD